VNESVGSFDLNYGPITEVGPDVNESVGSFDLNYEPIAEVAPDVIDLNVPPVQGSLML